jgi:hypothetical protein
MFSRVCVLPHERAADDEWLPPAAPGPLQLSKLPTLVGAPMQNEVAKQICFCPVCPPPPHTEAHTAQRKNFHPHFRKIHQTYTLLDENEAAALGTKGIGSFFAPHPKAPVAGALRY